MNADPVVCVRCDDIFDGDEARWWKWRRDCCSQECSDQQDAEDWSAAQRAGKVK